MKELQTDLLASKYINEATSITGFLTEYVFSSIVTEAKLQKLTGWEKKKRTEVQGKWKEETEAVLDAHIIATKLSIIFLSREMFSFHLSQQMHFFDNVGIQQKKHLKVIKAQLDTNSVLAFCTNSIPPGCIFKKEYAILPKIHRNWRVFYFYFFNVFYEVLT